MRVLLTWGSKHGGTEGIAQIVGQVLTARGFEIVSAPVREITTLDGFDAVVVGSGLYANRWLPNVRRFLNRHLAQLRRVPVWFFSSGPLDDSADHEQISSPTQVAVLAERVGALGHVIFGGRLESTVRDFPARAMAKTNAGDWRNPERIRGWASQLAEALPRARAGTPVRHPARSIPRLLVHAVVGWALCAITMAALLPVVSLTAALIIHGIAAPIYFALLAWHYFRARGAREPLATAASWTAIVILLDLSVVALGAQRSLGIFASIAGTWLPFALIFLVTWATGGVLSMMPAPQRRAHQRPPGTPAHAQR
jgi:menaquinone-dependent protoporphyrinogen oxidase